MDPGPVHHARLCDVFTLTVRAEITAYLLTYLFVFFSIAFARYYVSSANKVMVMVVYNYLQIANSSEIVLLLASRGNEGMHNNISLT